MKTILTILTTVALLAVFSLNAQVAINTDGSSPDGSAMLDIQSTTRGTSFPNLNIADMSTAAPVSSPKTGLIAYNTNSSTGPGLVMWTGTEWVMFELEGINWKLLGNAGTSSLTNFLGTTDGVSLPIRTNNTERMRVRSDGIVSVNSTGSFTGSTFYSLASGDDNAVDGNASGGGDAVYGQQTGDGNAIYGYADGSGRAVYGYQAGSGYAVRGYNGGTGTGVFGRANYSSAYGVGAYNGASTGTGVVASGNGIGTLYRLSDGSGIAGAGDDGVYGFGTASDGTGVIGVGNNNDSIFTLVGGTGGSFTGHSGIYAKVDGSSTGTGVIGAGYNVSTVSVTTTGSGGAFTGQQGVLGTAVASSGTGVIGVGNRNNGGSGYSTLPGGSGGAFTGTVCGVYGYASNTSGDRYGGYFYANGSNNPDRSYAYVGAMIGGTQYKINGNGSVSSIIKGVSGELLTLTCPEAPEILLQDYGIGQLVNGKAHITIDPDLAINLNVDPEHPIKVFVTLEGDCKGVYVTNKSVEGFDVIELQGGTSNVAFSWQIVATRADDYEQGVMVSDNSRRFQPAPGPLEDEIAKGNFIQQKTLQQKTVEVKDTEKDIKAKEVIEDTEK